MRPEDLGRFFEEALTRIEPKDDAHREKLARFREKMLAANEELAREVSSIQRETKRMMDRSGHEARVQRIRERTEAAKAASAEIATAWEEQNPLLERIIAATRARD